MRLNYAWKTVSLWKPVAIAALAGSLLLVAPLRAQTVTATVATGTNPATVAVNPVTNQTYVANANSNNVTVIDGATNAATTVTDPNAMGPAALAVNPITNRIYVANFASNNVTVIDGTTNTTTTVTNGNGLGPFAIAVNPVTNKIYVANQTSGNVTVIDGGKNTFVTVAAGTFPIAIALNPVTDQIYVANGHSANVTVIDGATNTTSTVAVGNLPTAVAVNPVTNKIYIPNAGTNNVTVIDGATNATTAVAAGTMPLAVAVNVVTNQIYVTNTASNNVTVIDGATNNTTTVAVGAFPDALAINTLTNQIYTGNFNSNNVTVIDGSTNATSTLTAGTGPEATAVNPVTNKIYIGNATSNNVTVIDGSTFTTATVATSSSANTAAINPVTNQIYVTVPNTNSVAVIDGATNNTTSIAVGAGAGPIAVNPLTNMIYAATSNSLYVIDGTTNTVTTTIPIGFNPGDVKVNTVTNMIYVANGIFDTTVTVINGATNAFTNVTAGSEPNSLAINPVTNQIYVADFSGNVTVIDGATNATTTITIAGTLGAIAVNPVTNIIYVTNRTTGVMSVIDGATNATTTVSGVGGGIGINSITNTIYAFGGGGVAVVDGATNAVTDIAPGTGGFGVGVDAATNTIYIPNFSNNNITVIDGATNTTTTLPAGTGPISVAVNSVTHQAYIPNGNSSNVTVVTQELLQAIPLVTTISPLAGNATTSPTPTFSFNSASTFAPTAPTPDHLYFQFDTVQGPWTAAAPNPVTPPPDYTATAPPLSAGTHTLYAFATDGQDGTSVMTTSNGGSSPLVGAIASYVFTVAPSAPLPSASLNPAMLTFASQVVNTTSPSQTVTLTNGGGANLILGATPLTFGGQDPGDYATTAGTTCAANLSIAPNGTCIVNVAFTPAATGARPATLTFTDNSGGVSGTTQQVVLNGTSTLAPANIAATGGTPQSATVGTAFAAPLAVTVTDVTGAPVPGITVTFSAPTAGPGGTFAGGVNTAISNANGVANSAIFTANGTAGSYFVSATVASLDTSVTFALTNNPAAGPASITATVGTPQSAIIGNAFATPFVVSVKTAAGGPVSGATVFFNTPESSGADGTFPDGAVNYTATTNANGLATATVFTANNIAGSYTVTATVQGTNLTANFSLTNNNPTPTLTSISPTTGTVGQSVTLTLTGTNFVSGAIVNFGSNADAGGLESNGTSITITIPAAQLTATGPVNVTVSNPAPSAGPSAAQVFTVNGAGLVISLGASVTVPTSTNSFSFPVQSVGGLAGVLNSYCASPSISCLISPCPTNLTANGSVMMTVTLYSTPQPTGILELRLPTLPGSHLWRVALACLFGLLVFGLLSARGPKIRWALATAALALGLVAGCSNSGLSRSGVPAGQYTMTITESLGSTTQKAQVTLNVQ